VAAVHSSASRCTVRGAKPGLAVNSGTAVSTKPVVAARPAAASSAWPCQATKPTSAAAGGSAEPSSHAPAQAAIASQATATVARKNGRRPHCHSGCVGASNAGRSRDSA